MAAASMGGSITRVYDVIMELTESLVTLLRDEPDVAAAWLFGSRARGTSHATSDVDVAVWLCPSLPRDVLDVRPFDLEARFSMALGLPVQVVSVERAPADLFRRVLRDGLLLVDRDRSGRLRLEVKKRNEYFDMTPIWRQIRRLPAGVDP